MSELARRLGTVVENAEHDRLVRMDGVIWNRLALSDPVMVDKWLRDAMEAVKRVRNDGEDWKR